MVLGSLCFSFVLCPCVESVLCVGCECVFFTSSTFALIVCICVPSYVICVCVSMSVYFIFTFCPCVHTFVCCLIACVYMCVDFNFVVFLYIFCVIQL